MPRSYRATILSEYGDQLGVLTDSEIARRVGCTQEHVSGVRKSVGIAAVPESAALRMGAARRRKDIMERLEAHSGWSDPAVSDSAIARDCRASPHTVQRYRPVSYSLADVAAQHPGWNDPYVSDATIVAESSVSISVVRARRTVSYVRPRSSPSLPPPRRYTARLHALLGVLREAPRTHGELVEILRTAQPTHLLTTAIRVGLVVRLQRGLYGITEEGRRHAQTPQEP